MSCQMKVQLWFGDATNSYISQLHPHTHTENPISFNFVILDFFFLIFIYINMTLFIIDK